MPYLFRTKEILRKQFLQSKTRSRTFFEAEVQTNGERVARIPSHMAPCGGDHARCMQSAGRDGVAAAFPDLRLAVEGIHSQKRQERSFGARSARTQCVVGVLTVNHGGFHLVIFDRWG